MNKFNKLFILTLIFLISLIHVYRVYSATITADNTVPELSIIKPENGLYLFNRRFLPLGRTIIFGPITIEIDADDTSGISKVEFYVDNELEETVIDDPFDWYMNLRLLRKHNLKIIAYDHAGNTATESKDITVYNFFGGN